MALPVYNITFNGYKLERNVDSLPTNSGIYMIYRCVYNPTTNKVNLKELFYIGKATNIHDEVRYHKRRDEFLAQAKQGEEICYANADVSRVQYDIIENALIYMQEPRLNNDLKDNYHHQNAEFHFSGRCDGLEYFNYQIVDGRIFPI